MGGSGWIWGDGEMSGGWMNGTKKAKKEKKKKECMSAQSKFERGIYEVAGDEIGEDSTSSLPDDHQK